MSPPSYSDLGEKARKIFDKGYHFGLWKLDVHTKTPTGIDFSTSGSTNQKNGEVFGFLEAKYSLPNYGLTVTEKWSVDKKLASEIAIKDKPLEGLDLSFAGTFTPETGSKESVFTIGYGTENLRVDSGISMDLDGPLVAIAAVAGYQEFVAGYDTAFDTAKQELKFNNFALGYTYQDYIVHAAVADGKEFYGSIFRKLNRAWDCGAQLTWTRGEESNDIQIGVGATFALSEEASVRAKVNNKLQLAVGFTQPIHKGITLSMSTFVDVKDLTFTKKKIGLALEFQA